MLSLSLPLVLFALFLSLSQQTQRSPSPRHLGAVFAGQTYNLTWSGVDATSPVTIELRRGDSANLTWIAYLTAGATDGFYLWTVSSDLPNASDYALQIFEMANVTNLNYSARFSLSGSALAPTAATGQAVGTAGTGSSMGTGTALPHNYPFVAAALTSLAATCSGLNGTCAGGAASTSTMTIAATDISLLNSATIATTTATGKGTQFGLSVKYNLLSAAMVMLAIL